MSEDMRFRAARLVLALRQAGVTDQRIAEALEKTPREPFVPRPFLDSAWDDVELPIDCGQTLSRPVIVGVMLQALDPQPDDAVLEIGAGSGYVAAVLARLARRVCSIERYRTLAERARLALEQAGVLSRVELLHGDGLLGWPEGGSFDRILLMGAVPSPPERLLGQLRGGGALVAPIVRNGAQAIVRFDKKEDASFQETVIGAGAFTPLQPGVAREL